MSQLPVGTTEQDIVAMRGQRWSRQTLLPLSQGDLTGVILTMTLKRARDLNLPGDTAALAQIDNDGLGGVVIDDGSHATFTLAEAVMRSLPDEDIRYDVQALLPSGQKETPLIGRFQLARDVTRG